MCGVLVFWNPIKFGMGSCLHEAVYLHSPIRLHGVIIKLKHRVKFTLRYLGHAQRYSAELRRG
jgi:hypothetical protein